MTGARVRAARERDLAAAAELGADLVRFHHGLDPQRFAVLAEPLEPGYARFLAARLRDSRAVVLVAESAEPGKSGRTGGVEIVGYAYGQMEGMSWMELLEAHGRLHDLVVRPAWRGRGVGRLLMQELMAGLRGLGAERMVLSVAAANPEARGFFERLGFRETMVEMTYAGGRD